MAEASSIRPQSSANIEQWHFEADVVVAGYGIAGVSASIEAAASGRRRVGARAHERLGRRCGAGRRIHLSGRRDPVAAGTRVRGLPRQHEIVHDGRTRSRRRRGEDHRLLRRQRRALQLARRQRCAVQGEFLRPTRLGNTPSTTDSCIPAARTRHRSTRSRHRPLAGTFHR